MNKFNFKIDLIKSNCSIRVMRRQGQVRVVEASRRRRTQVKIPPRVARARSCRGCCTEVMRWTELGLPPHRCYLAMKDFSSTLFNDIGTIAEWLLV